MAIMSPTPGHRHARHAAIDDGRGWQHDACHYGVRLCAFASLDTRLVGQLVLREIEVGYVYVDFLDDKPRHLVNALHDVATHRLRYLWNANAVIHYGRQINRSLTLTHFDADPGRTCIGAGDAGSKIREPTRGKLVDTLDLARSYASDLGDDTIGDVGLALAVGI